MSAVFEVAAPCAEFAACVPNAPRVVLYLPAGLGLEVRLGDRVRVLSLNEPGTRYTGATATIEVTTVATTGTKSDATQTIIGRVLSLWGSGAFPVNPVPVCSMLPSP